MNKVGFVSIIARVGIRLIFESTNVGCDNSNERGMLCASMSSLFYLSDPPKQHVELVPDSSD